MLGQKQGKSAAASWLAFDLQASAQQARNLARNRQAQACAAVFAIGRAIDLLKRFKNKLLFFARNADAGVAHFKRQSAQTRVGCQIFVGRRQSHQHRDAAAFGELERVREQVFQDLLQALHIGVDAVGRIGRNLDFEIEVFASSDWLESALHRVANIAQGNGVDFDFHLARFHFRQIENLVDEIEQIAAAGVNRRCEFDLFRCQIVVVVFRQQLGQNQHRVERRAQFVAHVRQKLRLVFGTQCQLLGFVFQSRTRQFDFVVFLLDFDVLLRQFFGFFFQLVRLGFQLDIGLLELFLLRLQFLRLALQFLRQRLRLFEQFFGAHIGADHVEHDAQRFHQLIQKREMNFAEIVKGRQLDHGHDVAFKQNRQHDDVARSRFAQTGIDLNVIVGHARQQNAFLFQRALTDHAFAQLELIGNRFALAISVSRAQCEYSIGHVEGKKRAMMSRNQRRQFAHDEARDIFQVFLALHHARKTREVGLEPVLLVVQLRR